MKRLVVLSLLLAACAKASTNPPPSKALIPDSSAQPKQKNAVVGERVPSFFSIESTTTKDMMEIVPGKVTLVMFWATWHSPSAHAFPKLTALYEKYEPRGFTIAALSVDEDAAGYKLYDFAQLHRGHFPVGWDAKHDIASKWGVSSMPTFFLIDKGGIVRDIRYGFHDGDDKLIEEKMLVLLGAP